MSDPTPFEERARELLEQSSARTDGRTQSRLTQARHAALERLQRPARPRWFALVPAGAAAGAAVLAVVMWGGRPGNEGGEGTVPIVQGASPVDDMELLTDADAAYIVDGEDLEFYEWAAGELES